jgi:prepilin-type N-terminal cleavage/methylation domain-containing protein
MNKIGNPQSEIKNFRAFTLIELLTVIAIISTLAGFTLVVTKPAARMKYVKTAQAELNQIEIALDNYKAKYGVYPPGNTQTAYASPLTNLLPQLYYELCGTTNDGVNFVSPDGSSVPIGTVHLYYGASGFINCSKGGDEDSVKAPNFLPGLTPKQLYVNWTNIPSVGVPTTILITSVGGPDQNYHPLNPVDHVGPNPFRYLYPGVNNPNSYDLWVQLVISGKTNLICNWSKQVQINTSLP